MAQDGTPGRITAMAEDERRLRDAAAAGEIDGAAEREQPGSLERALDQCWDLLRQRRAKTGFGGNPDGARVRPSSQVEGYRP